MAFLGKLPVEFAASGLLARSSIRAAGRGLFATEGAEAGDLLLVVPSGRPKTESLKSLENSELKYSQASSSSSGATYRLAQGLSPKEALRGVSLPRSARGSEDQIGALLADPRQWRAVAAPRHVMASRDKDSSENAIELQSSKLFFAVAALTRAPNAQQSYSIHGLVNHSCNPSVQRTFALEKDEIDQESQQQAKLVLRAAKQLQAEEELMDSYFFSLVPLQERERLLSLLGPEATFQCNCERCTAERLYGDGSFATQAWAELRRIVAELALLRASRPPQILSAAFGVRDTLFAQPAAREILKHLQELLEDDRCELNGTLSPSWCVGAVLLADLQVAVQGDFDAAIKTLGRTATALQQVSPGSATLLEVLATQATYAAVNAVNFQGGRELELQTAVQDVCRVHDLVVGSPHAGSSEPLWSLQPLQIFLKRLEALPPAETTSSS
eukprot:TRINITY_DN9174_c0_g1_i1.p1 TRINITY_DN9174_c0_g1~~TRINITY_DN9174_c0_g1_i1.p1  ORF type:complete len:450 (+),score=99.58 TRINITY_DN9174_c0_g1_i1:23-1351(+)